MRCHFIESVGESKLGELKPHLVDGSYVRMYQCCSGILADNNGGQYIWSLIEAISSAHKIKLESVGGLEDEQEIKRVINYLNEQLLVWRRFVIAIAITFMLSAKIANWSELEQIQRVLYPSWHVFTHFLS